MVDRTVDWDIFLEVLEDDDSLPEAVNLVFLDGMYWGKGGGYCIV